MPIRITLMVLFLASMCSTSLLAQNRDFSFELNIEDGGLRMSSNYGTAWKELQTYSVLTNTYYVSNYGTFSDENEPENTSFFIKIHLKRETLTLEGLSGTNWDSYTFDCPDKTCKFFITQQDVKTTTSDKSSINDKKVAKRLKELEAKKDEVQKKEKEKLKAAISKLSENEFSKAEIDSLKMDLAQKSAKNIENQLAIIENSIEYFERNQEDIYMDQGDSDGKSELSINLGGRNLINITEKVEIENKTSKTKKPKPLKERDLPYSSRTSGAVFSSLSFNNAVLDGGSIDDTPFKFGGSRSFEIGYEWSTRVFKETNFLRLNYGVSVQFNGLKPKNNSVFVQNGEQTELEEFGFDLDKSKFRMDNLIVPVHLQFGSSKTTVLDNGNKRFSDHDFKVGLGGFAGINLLNTQKLKYNDSRTDVKLRERDDFNTNDLLYGLSAYIGWENVAVFAQYNLNSIFSDNLTDLNNFQIGIRTHWD